MCGLKMKTEDSYLPTCTFTLSSRNPFSLPVQILTQIGIILLVMIHIRHWIGRTFCNLHVVDIWFIPARTFPQEEVFCLISVAMSWGDFSFLWAHQTSQRNRAKYVWHLAQTTHEKRWARTGWSSASESAAVLCAGPSEWAHRGSWNSLENTLEIAESSC